MLNPVRDHIIVAVKPQEAVSRGGIVIPDAALEKPSCGKVVAANPGYYMNGMYQSIEVAAGDTVYFGRSHGTEIKHDGEVYLVISEEFILCKETNHAE